MYDSRTAIDAWSTSTVVIGGTKPCCETHLCRVSAAVPWKAPPSISSKQPIVVNARPLNIQARLESTVAVALEVAEAEAEAEAEADRVALAVADDVAVELAVAEAEADIVIPEHAPSNPNVVSARTFSMHVQVPNIIVLLWRTAAHALPLCR